MLLLFEAPGTEQLKGLKHILKIKVILVYLVHYSELAINPEWSGQNSHCIFYLRPVYTKDDNYKV